MPQLIKRFDQTAMDTRKKEEKQLALRNILAVNAAFEAARAGESGAGFSMEADEATNSAVQMTEESGEKIKEDW